LAAIGNTFTKISQFFYF